MGSSSFRVFHGNYMSDLEMKSKCLIYKNHDFWQKNVSSDKELVFFFGTSVGKSEKMEGTWNRWVGYEKIFLGRWGSKFLLYHQEKKTFRLNTLFGFSHSKALRHQSFNRQPIRFLCEGFLSRLHG
jgi:hypothetical protein